MCVAFPGKIIKIEDQIATVDFDGVQKKISLFLAPDCQQDDYVLIHAGFAIQKVDADSAKNTLNRQKKYLSHEKKS